jgi:hypothetical protein
MPSPLRGQRWYSAEAVILAITWNSAVRASLGLAVAEAVVVSAGCVGRRGAAPYDA